MSPTTIYSGKVFHIHFTFLADNYLLPFKRISSPRRMDRRKLDHPHQNRAKEKHPLLDAYAGYSIADNFANTGINNHRCCNNPISIAEYPGRIISPTIHDSGSTE